MSASITLKTVGTVKPKVCFVDGTDEDYGLHRRWTGISKTTQTGGAIRFDIWDDDCIVEVREDGSKTYYSVHGDTMVDISECVPDSIGDYMRENRCDYQDAWSDVWDELQSYHKPKRVSKASDLDIEEL